MRSCSETARSRRASYQNQRSQTLDALPLQLIHPAPILSLTDQRSSLDSQDEAGSASEESRLLGSTEGSPFHASRDSGRSSRENHLSSSGGRGTTARLTLAKNLSFQNVLSENALNHQRLTSGSGSTRSSKLFLRKSSDNDLLYSGCSSTRLHLERSPSSSSALLAKVKDRIVDTFFQTSSEGPHLAAIVQERRQRAAEEYEARLSLFRAQHQLQTNSRPGSLSSDSGSTERVHSNQGSTRRSRTPVGEGSAAAAAAGQQTPVDAEAVRFAKSRRDGARAAFRRRSVSEDNCLPLQGLHAKARCPVLGNGSVAGSQAGGLQGGIVCSTDDFQALVSGLGHRRGLSFGGSRSRCMGPRAMSFDQSRQLRPSGSMFGGDYGPAGDSNCSGGILQRISNSSKILETFEEAASDCPGSTHPGGLTRRGPHNEDEDEDPTSTRKNHLGSTTNRLSNGAANDAQSQHRKQMNAPEVVSDDSPTSGSGHVPLAVPEVEFDSNGQTWDVYGAELDPEILGNAIQIHLSKLIASNNHDALVTRPPSPRDRHHSTATVVVVKDCRDEVPRCSREPADIGCLRRYFCIFSSGDDS